ncbi:flavin-containing monooxygenase [Mycobacteroides abscessus]|uniref:flavin-containing monooxygenase n=1 Tax=Mycobacteroides abscessus TaxID=36809 RepID=UPI000D6A443C|nr:NAD(P)/FAD-dependent oxidoreductase [Mycobacteroides abscessus]
MSTPACLSVPDHEVVVVGAGFGGIGVGVALRNAGIEDFVMIDRWPAVGGTWFVNTYPGVAVDIPSAVYSFSFEQRSDWSRVFAPGAELRRYAEHVVDKYGLRPKLRLGKTVNRAAFDEQHHIWRIAMDDGAEITARFLVLAVGGLECPKLPDIAGIDSFGGKVIHTARWDHDYDLAGKRVAVIGTGASALQLVPEIAERVAHLSVFQRTPIWVSPKPDIALGPVASFILRRAIARAALRWTGHAGVEFLAALMVSLNRRAPGIGRTIEARTREWMRTQVHDPKVRDQLTPKYTYGCKRPSMSNTYLKTFNRPDVELVVDPIERITAAGIVTADGVEREVDAVICATGFKVMERGSTPAFPLVGRGGTDLGNFWHENRFQAYHGVSVPGFPNLFFNSGPYGYAPGSYLCMIESTAAHLARAISETRRRGATCCEIRQEPHDRYYAKSYRRSHNMALLSGACAGSNTYYINYQGDAPAIRPSLNVEMWWQNRHFPLDDYKYSLATPRNRQPGAAVHKKAATVRSESVVAVQRFGN